MEGSCIKEKHRKQPPVSIRAQRALTSAVSRSWKSATSAWAADTASAAAVRTAVTRKREDKDEEVDEGGGNYVE